MIQEAIDELKATVVAIAQRDVELAGHFWTVIKHMIEMSGAEPGAQPRATAPAVPAPTPVEATPPPETMPVEATPVAQETTNAS